MFDDIGFLVQETFKEVENPETKGFFNNFFNKEELPEEVPGFLYHLQKKASTFVIRIHPSENLKDDYKNIIKHPNLHPGLRLEEDSLPVKEKLKYFECDRVEIARNIKQHLGNKRFPMFEERIFNVSDPGDSWWLSLEENKIKILFKLSHTEDLGRLIKLGPLGEMQKNIDIFGQLFGYFNMIFPVEDYSSAHGQLTISCKESEHLYFNLFKKLITTGETSHEFWDYLRRLEVEAEGKPFLASLQQANYFLMELGFIRSFWKSIEQDL